MEAGAEEERGQACVVGIVCRRQCVVGIRRTYGLHRNVEVGEGRGGDSV